jgi:hypothetical protein
MCCPGGQRIAANIKYRIFPISNTANMVGDALAQGGSSSYSGILI